MRMDGSRVTGSGDPADLARLAIASPPTGAACQSCGDRRLVPFYRVERIPTQTTVLLDTEQEAREYPTGEVLLACCVTCGFIQNVLFDPSLIDYSIPTEESQAFSATFSAFASGLADELVRRYQLEGKSVLEIGCGKGDFLTLLAERGIGSGLGIDPGFLPNRPEQAASRLQFVRDWYGPESTGLTGDLVVTRHLMEHLPNVSEFLGWLRQSVSATEGAAMFTEVPDVERVFAETAFWDIYYEHCSYYTRESLRRALEAAGFSVRWLEMGFDEQYLLAGSVPGEPKPARMGEEEAHQLGSLIEGFVTDATDRITSWRHRITSAIAAGRGVTIWGGGSKTVAFLAAVGVSDVTVVDINPFKQSKWLPSVAVEVEAPETLVDRHPDLVIPMNRAYVGEITRDLNAMGLSPEVLPA